MSGMEPAVMAALISATSSVAMSQMNKPKDIEPPKITADTGQVIDTQQKATFDETAENSKRQTLSKSRLGTKQLQVALDTSGSGVNVGSTAANAGLGIKI